MSNNDNTASNSYLIEAQEAVNNTINKNDNKNLEVWRNDHSNWFGSQEELDGEQNKESKINTPIGLPFHQIIIEKSYKETQAIKKYWLEKSWNNKKIISKTYKTDNLYFRCSKHNKYRCGTKNLGELRLFNNPNYKITTELLFGDKYIVNGDIIPMIIKMLDCNFRELVTNPCCKELYEKYELAQKEYVLPCIHGYKGACFIVDDCRLYYPPSQNNSNWMYFWGKVRTFFNHLKNFPSIHTLHISDWEGARRYNFLCDYGNFSKWSYFEKQIKDYDEYLKTEKGKYEYNDIINNVNIETLIIMKINGYKSPLF